MILVMNSIFSTSFFVPLNSSFPRAPPFLQLQPLYAFGHHRYSNIYNQSSVSIQFPPISVHRLHVLKSSIRAAISSNDGTVSVVQFEDFVEKDWSFLDGENMVADEEHMQKIDLIISAGNIVETSKVMISIGSEAFVDRVVNSSPCARLLVVHDSLFILACIKEKYDKVKCWQGELINVPEKWTAFDVIFLYFLPALPNKLDHVLEALSGRCLPGARVVISHPQGRQAVEEQRYQHPDVVVSNLPQKMTLQSNAADHSFKMIKFIDEPGFYLAVLEFNEMTLAK
ncbi:hypothetical protein Fot_35394 [Forsythia ovata]|uniref:Uncharacterized protein n=1 Tax=Forsythia ovata TaxID=205694 RepID=A0ABD1SLD6_9LAMI